MFGAYVYEISSAEYENNVLLIDEDGLEEKTEYSRYFTDHGFSVIRYENDLLYRSKIEGQVKAGTEKFLMIARPGTYIPYDDLKGPLRQSRSSRSCLMNGERGPHFIIPAIN